MTIGTAGYVSITSYKPTNPTGYAFLCCQLVGYNNVSSKTAFVIDAMGDYVTGTANATVSSLTVQYVYAKGIERI